MTVYAINTDNFAVTDYTGEFDNVHAICEANGKTVAITDTKIYEHTGTDDDGTNIAAHIKTGQINFGDEERAKTVPRAYLHIVNDEQAKVTTTTRTRREEKDREYVVRKRDNTYKTAQLVKLAQGVESVDWGFKVENTNGGTLEIKNIRVLPRLSRVMR